MPDRPDISILMPNYNGQRFIGEAIRSTVAQTLTSWELIVLDDGSSDQSKSIVRQWMQKDARIRLEELEHGGIVKALNRGIEVARADVIARMDSDDFMFPDRLHRQYESLSSFPDSLLGGQAILCDPHLRTLGLLNPPLQHEAILKACLAGMASSLMHPTLMCHRFALLRLGGYREQYRHIEDLDLYLRSARNGFQLANLGGAPLLRYRMHSRSISNAKNQLQMELKQMLLKEMEKEAQMTPDWDGLKRAADMMPKNHADFYRRWAVIAFANQRSAIGYRYLLQSMVTWPWLFSGWLKTLKILKFHLFRSI